MSAANARRNKACVVGGGVIGGGWAARFLLNGWDVAVVDPQAQTRRHLEQVLDNARCSLPLLSDHALPPEGQLSFVAEIEAAVAGARWIQESVPEQLALKQDVLAEIQRHADPSAVVASSTSGFRPSELRQASRHPEQIIVAHPFNPVYLLPLVEVVGARHTEDDAVVTKILRQLGMMPLIVRHEIDAHIADRMLEAVWREALWLINDDIATTAEIDDAIRFGFGLRWAQMGLFETYRLAGGEQGMAHFIQQFGPALKWPWTKLMDVPDLTTELVEKIASQSDAQSGAYSITELERVRDRNLVGILRALKERRWGAGVTLAGHDEYLATQERNSHGDWTCDEAPLRVHAVTVLPAWIDYNGHMTEYRYLQVFSDASDRLLEHVGMNQDYVASGYSYFTVETHILHIDECKLGQSLYCTTQILPGDDKRLHIFHRLHAANGDKLIATAEQMLLHVEQGANKVCAAKEPVLGKLAQLASSHAALPVPTAVGRFVGQRTTG